MPDLNRKRPVVVGGPAEQRDKIVDCTACVCDGCGAAVYVTGFVLRQTLEMAAAQGNGAPYTLCWACSQPWIEELARMDGRAACGDYDMLRDELLPRIAEARAKQTMRN